MRPEEIPQDATPRGIRGVVEAIRAGALTQDEVGRRASLSRRHVNYHLRAAQALDLLERTGRWYRITSRGDDWLGTVPESAGDRAAFGQALAASALVRRLVPTLLDDEPPSEDHVLKQILRLSQPALAAETARRRAQTLLRWRRYVRADDPELFDRPVTASRAAAAPAPQPSTPGHPLRLVQVTNYGCLRDAEARFGPITVILGANAAGKTTLFDVVGLVSDILQRDLPSALLERARALEELLWFGQGDRFAFALEFGVPEGLRHNGFEVVRYEVEVGREGEAGAHVLYEGLFLKPAEPSASQLHPEKSPRSWRKVLGLSASGTGFYRSERTDWKTVFQLGSTRLALSQVQADTTRFPVALWLRDVLVRGVQRLELNSKRMREPASPLLERKFLPDGSNLPIVARRLRKETPDRFKQWVENLATVLPDLEDVKIVEREEDKHLYLKLRYRGGLELPAWRVSDGTLRLLALTLLPYLDVEDAIYLIEEPENGIHPQALEAVYQALSSCYRSQVLVATHSPVFLGIVPTDQILLLVKEGGATRIVPGPDHPVLRGWRRQADLSTLFAAGVLT